MPSPSSAARLDRCTCLVLLSSLSLLILPLLLTLGLYPKASENQGRASFQGTVLRKPTAPDTESMAAKRYLAPPEVHNGKPEMISNPKSSAHGSTLVATPEGAVICAWFGGSREGASDVGIYFSTRSPSGEWSESKLLTKASDEAHWNPVMFWYPEPTKDDSNGKLWLHFKVGDFIPSWRTYYTTSADQGKTWSQPFELVAGNKGGRGCVKNKPLVLRTGELLAGASLEDGQWRAFMDGSKDGLHWEAGEVLQVSDEEAGVIQPTLWQSSGADVHALLRSDTGHVYRADSADGGKTWGPARRSGLPNNNSGLDVARLADGTLVLAYNPTAGEWAARYPLRLAISEDNGNSWSLYWDVETEPGEYSYPAIIPWNDAYKGVGFCLSYTWKRRNIGFVSMSLAHLRRVGSTHKGV